MVKRITQYSVWKVSRYGWFVIASCAATKHVELFIANEPLNPVMLDPMAKMPDIRLYVPCKWQQMPATIRASIRAQFGRVLDEKFGAETLTSKLVPWVNR